MNAVLTFVDEADLKNSTNYLVHITRRIGVFDKTEVAQALREWADALAPRQPGQQVRKLQEILETVKAGGEVDGYLFFDQVEKVIAEEYP